MRDSCRVITTNRCECVPPGGPLPPGAKSGRQGLWDTRPCASASARVMPAINLVLDLILFVGDPCCGTLSSSDVEKQRMYDCPALRWTVSANSSSSCPMPRGSAAYPSDPNRRSDVLLSYGVGCFEGSPVGESLFGRGRRPPGHLRFPYCPLAHDQLRLAVLIGNGTLLVARVVESLGMTGEPGDRV